MYGNKKFVSRGFFSLYLKDTDIKEIHKSKQEIEPKIDTKKK